MDVQQTQTAQANPYSQYIDLTQPEQPSAQATPTETAPAPAQAEPAPENQYKNYIDLSQIEQPTPEPTAAQTPTQSPAQDDPYKNYIDLSAPNSDAGNEENSSGVNIYDYGKSIYAGLEQLSAAGQSGLAYLAKKIDDPEVAKRLEEKATKYRNDEFATINSMSPDAKRALEASVTSGEFWDAPALSASLKLANISPTIALSVLPMGIISEVGLGFKIAGAAGAATATGAATGAGIGVGSYVDAVARKVDDASDAALQKQSSMYADLRTNGVSEADARSQFKTFLTNDGAALVNGTVGAIANIVGLPAVLSKTGLGKATAEGAVEAFGGSTARNIVIGAGAEAVQAAVPAAAQASIENYTEQKAGIAGGFQKDINTGEVVDAAVNSAAMSALPGAAIGAKRGYTHGTGKVEINNGVSSAEAAALDTVINKKAEEGPIDAGQNTSETPETLAEQNKAVVEGRRPATMYPLGTRAPADVADGLVRTTIEGHRFDYDPKRTSREEITQHLRNDTIGEFLGYGPQSKADVFNAIKRGEKPSVVTETTPTGTEVKSALTTETKAQETLDAVRSTAAPENTVEVQPVSAVDKILADREQKPSETIQKIKNKAAGLTTTVTTVPRQAIANINNLGRAVKDKTAFRHTLAWDLDRLLTDTAGPIPYAKGYEHRATREIDRERRAMSQTTRNMEQHLGGTDAVDRLAQWKSDPNFKEAMDLVHEARRLDVNLFTDNAHLGKDDQKFWRSRKKEPELKSRWEELSNKNPQLMGDVKNALDVLQNYHSERSISKVRAILDGTDAPKGLADRFYNDTMTPEDERWLGSEGVHESKYASIGELLRTLKDAKALSKISGTYVPLSRPRTASHVVTAKLKIRDLPEGARRIADSNVVEFAARPGESEAALRRRVKDFVENDKYDVENIRRGYKAKEFIGRDGEFVSEDTPNAEAVLTNKTEKEASNAVPVYQVYLKTDYVEFAGSEGKAREMARALKEDGNYEEISFSQKKPNSFEGVGVGPLTPMMDALEKRLTSQQKFKELPIEDQEILRDALHEATLRLRAGTSIGLNDLRSRNVLGHTLDLPENMAHIVKKSSLDIARSTHFPKIERLMADLEKQIEGNKKNTEGYARARELFDEFKSRVFDFSETGAKDGQYMRLIRAGSQRLTQLSALRSLFGVSYNAINATDAPMAAGPTLSARYGFAKVNAAMSKAFVDIGGAKDIAHGVTRTVKALNVFNKDKSSYDHIDYFKSQIPAKDRAELGRVLDYMRDNGAITGAVELSYAEHLNSIDATWAGKQIDWLDHASRQVGNAVDSVGRAVTALTTYRLEKERLTKEVRAGRMSFVHEDALAGDAPLTDAEKVAKTKAAIERKATELAYEDVLSTLGDFTAANSAPITRAPVIQWAVQFKRYSIKTAHLVGRMLGEAKRGNPVAAKALGFTLGAQIFMTGIAGLPLGPAKTAYWAYKTANGDTYSENDYERDMRSIASGIVHFLRPNIKNDKVAVEAVSHGIWRVLGIEVSSRMSMDNFFFDRLPNLNKKGDFESWLGETVTGAPGSTFKQMINSAVEFVKDPSVKKAIDVVPIRAVQDLNKAITNYNEPKKTGTDFKKSEPYTLGEAVRKGLGFSTSREANENAAQRAFDEGKTRREAFRSEINHQWLNADPDARSKLIKKINEHNANLGPDEERIKISELNKYAREHRAKDKPSKTFYGRTVGRKDKPLVRDIKEKFGL